MFNQLSSLMKATLFYSIALCLSLLLVLLMQFVVTRDITTHASWQILGLHRLGLRAWGFAILAPFVVLFCTYAIAWGMRFGRLDQTALNGAFALDGLVTLIRVVGLEMYSYCLSYLSSSINMTAPGLKLLYLLPFVWLLLESSKKISPVRSLKLSVQQKETI